MADYVAVILDFYICVILTIEYFFGRSDTDIRNEDKKKRRIRRETHIEHLAIGEHK